MAIFRVCKNLFNQIKELFFVEYEILDRYECGLELQGTEVKSLRAGGISIVEAFAMPKGNELFIFKMRISPYEMGNRFNHLPERARRLLLHRREINKLIGQVTQKGLTLVPLRVYFKGSLAKLELGVCKGKKLHDKREALKKKDTDRDIRRTMRNRQ